MANRMHRLLQMGKDGVTPPPFSKTNVNYIAHTNSSSEAIDNTESTPSTSNSKKNVTSPHKLNMSTDNTIDVIPDINSKGDNENDSQSPKVQKRKRSISSSSSSSSSTSSSTSSSSSSSTSNEHLMKEDPSSSKTQVDILRKPNQSDYAAVGMTSPEYVSIPNDTDTTIKIMNQTSNEQLVHFQEGIDDGNDSQSLKVQKRKRSISSSSSESSSSSSSSSSKSISTSSSSSSSTYNKRLMKEDSSSNKTQVDILRMPNQSDYAAVGMTLPGYVSIANDTDTTTIKTMDRTSNDQIVHFQEVIDDDTRETLSSPTILQSYNMDTVNNLENEMQNTSRYNEDSEATPKNISLENDKENQKPSFQSGNLNEAVDFPSGSGEEYLPSTGSGHSKSSSSSSSNMTEQTKRGKKRVRNEVKWKQNERKYLKNSGKAYLSKNGKQMQSKNMKPPCHSCKFSCGTKFTNKERKEIFNRYWDLGSLQRQRDFLSACINIQDIACRRLKNPAKARTPNCWFSFVRNGKTHRICKIFLLNTLGIAQRTLRTVIEAKTSDSGIAPADNRGKHGKQQKSDPEVLQSIREHINSVPRVESHYLRANTSREFIDGGLTLAALHRDYQSQRGRTGKEAATLYMYSHIFNTEFNISFFIPKKDQCNFCESYKNSSDDRKRELEQQFDDHQKEKVLSRADKANDIEICRGPENKVIVAIYDLQAQLPVPIGNSSAFFYKSKLNCYNFTITNIKNGSTTCFFWHEGLGSKGSVEIGTCVYKFLQKVAVDYPDYDVIFYSDNCCGQQKNRFMFSMYHYAVEKLAINSVCHKFLIAGHTQNEGDNAHSLIEKSIKRAKKSAPIYVPDQYVNLIRGAKKRGNSFIVQEMNYSDFYDLKALADELGINFHKACNGDAIKMTELTMIKYTKNKETFEYKISYEGEWIAANLQLVRRRNKKQPSANINALDLKPAYHSKMCISEAKKNDLLQLLNSNIVPSYYGDFYNNL